jgi:hypothetical protein
VKVTEVQSALAHIFSGIAVPNLNFGGFELDMAIISKDWYLTEVEIKMSRSDWCRDKHKRKWRLDELGCEYERTKRQQVARFFYAAPAELIATPPKFVSPDAGLIKIVEHHPGYIRAYVERQARRQKCERLKANDINSIMRALNWRLWHGRFGKHDEAQRIA